MKIKDFQVQIFKDAQRNIIVGFEVAELRNFIVSITANMEKVLIKATEDGETINIDHSGFADDCINYLLTGDKDGPKVAERHHRYANQKLDS